MFIYSFLICLPGLLFYCSVIFNNRNMLVAIWLFLWYAIFICIFQKHTREIRHLTTLNAFKILSILFDYNLLHEFVRGKNDLFLWSSLIFHLLSPLWSFWFYILTFIKSLKNQAIVLLCIWLVHDISSVDHALFRSAGLLDPEELKNALWDPNCWIIAGNISKACLYLLVSCCCKQESLKHSFTKEISLIN